MSHFEIIDMSGDMVKIRREELMKVFQDNLFTLYGMTMQEIAGAGKTIEELKGEVEDLGYQLMDAYERCE